LPPLERASVLIFTREPYTTLREVFAPASSARESGIGARCDRGIQWTRRATLVRPNAAERRRRTL